MSSSTWRPERASAGAGMPRTKAWSNSATSYSHPERFQYDLTLTPCRSCGLVTLPVEVKFPPGSRRSTHGQTSSQELHGIAAQHDSRDRAEGRPHRAAGREEV